jgi:hypothetical protein
MFKTLLVAALGLGLMIAPVMASKVIAGRGTTAAGHGTNTSPSDPSHATPKRNPHFNRPNSGGRGVVYFVVDRTPHDAVPQKKGWWGPRPYPYPYPYPAPYYVPPHPCIARIFGIGLGCS